MNMSGEMQELIGKINNFLIHFPNRKNVSILEGRSKNMEALLYELKGLGIIGLFDTADVPTSNEKGALEDVLYMFDIDKDRFEKFKKGELKNEKVYGVSYDVNQTILFYGGKEIKIEPDSRQAYLLKFMFGQKINTPISWDVLYEEVVGKEAGEKEKARKSISDTVRAINDKFQDEAPGLMLLEWRGKSVYRLL
ncbi:MAG: hypothetical protein LiPW15_90 [Parcubacteria group bacterium LiPW_15]|nr:MAG: hypothetical protein LiPW15_90 [Parcubacteria group bacterium LiPW_15]